MTNRGRSALFCPYFMTWNKASQWSIVAARGPITGLIIDALTVDAFRFQSIGVSINDSAINRRSTMLRHNPMLLSLNAESAMPFDIWSYLTRATLSGVTQLHVRKIGDWCDGLCIYHDNGSVETLGRWDPSDDKVVLHIYDSRRDGPLTALTFRYATEDKYQSHIADIVIGDSPGAGQTYVWRAADDQPHIAWWLTKVRDHITPWHDGRFPLRPAWKKEAKPLLMQPD